MQYDAFDDQVASGNMYKLPLTRKLNEYNKNIEDRCRHSVEIINLCNLSKYTAAGPVPKFFSDEPSKSLDELRKSPEFAFGCLQALVAKLVKRGELSR